MGIIGSERHVQIGGQIALGERFFHRQIVDLFLGLVGAGVDRALRAHFEERRAKLAIGRKGPARRRIGMSIGTAQHRRFPVIRLARFLHDDRPVAQQQEKSEPGDQRRAAAGRQDQHRACGDTERRCRRRDDRGEAAVDHEILEQAGRDQGEGECDNAADHRRDKRRDRQVQALTAGGVDHALPDGMVLVSFW